MNILFKTIVGSQAYGTNTVNSDIDYKGVYAQSTKELIGFNYLEQIDVNKDECYYEVRRYLQLLQSANPTMLELLFMPKDCIIEKHPAFDLIIRERDKFLTKKCLHSFGGYAIAQIKKARGLQKKMNWEHDKVKRKSPYDFCYVYENGKTISLLTYLGINQLLENQCGLVALNHFKDCFSLYYDAQNTLGYHGIVTEKGNALKLSSIPQGEQPVTILYYNQEGYSAHCREYNQYNEWLTNRNTQRYVDINNHGQQIDGKNLLHCRRLLDIAREIATEGTINVRRPNAKELLKIRHGEINLDAFIENTEYDIQQLHQLYDISTLPDDVEIPFVNSLLLAVREAVNL
ncbi:nucleotidyltransferase domain-containing protein [Arcicella aquatica]|uniref:Nucleotidyltransferase domain-containing protein n=1 Tax=Arcicella aquatica TaxID=217141 RepID=A0ABU5QLZ2_9BACT|nr:nucleotidyltransferase domain-containing protein [Arcicella aquatica]MEA5257451.1 nucleotidyltransferase domain-containing protein [Arcicella aquatica]